MIGGYYILFIIFCQNQRTIVMPRLIFLFILLTKSINCFKLVIASGLIFSIPYKSHSLETIISKQSLEDFFQLKLKHSNYNQIKEKNQMIKEKKHNKNRLKNLK